jgi:hypothetical protein
MNRREVLRSLAGASALSASASSASRAAPTIVPELPEKKGIRDWDCYTDDWKRTDPDFVVYLPRTPRGSDGYADHFLVEYTPRGNLLAVWTQSGIEGSRDTRVVFSRSEDGGRTWTLPGVIAGPDSYGLIAAFAMPVMSRSGRIYAFYSREKGIVDLGFRGTSVMGSHFSDDDGRSWQDSGLEIPWGRTKYDHPDPKVPCNIIAWQKPVLDAKDRPLIPFTRASSREVFSASAPNSWGVRNMDAQGGFLRVDNVDRGPHPSDLKLSWLPGTEGALRFPHAREPERSRGYHLFHEPSVALLSDGNLFSTASSLSGHLLYSVSEDPDGVNWRKPAPLLYRDGGTPLLHPIAPAPMVKLKDGRFLVFYHGHDGSKHGGLGPRDMRGRRPMCVSLGEYRPQARQPVWFSQPKVLCDTHGVGAGPGSLVWLAMYASLTERGKERIFWYPDRKHFLLGRRITDELLADLEVPKA